MISHLQGLLIEATPSFCIIECAGVGFELGISSNTYAVLPTARSGEIACKLLVRERISESAFDLFGFATSEERLLFDKLLQINGIGPKVALAVLSQYSPQQLASLALSQDMEALTAVPGIGKKTAERLNLELKNMFAQDAQMKSVMAAQPPTASQETLADALLEARAALVSMGFSMDEANNALQGATALEQENPQAALRYALRKLGGA